MADALEQLKERLAEVADLGKVARLLAWDQQTMMPPAGTGHRADQFSTLLRIVHERFTDPEVGPARSTSCARSRIRSSRTRTTAR